MGGKGVGSTADWDAGVRNDLMGVISLVMGGTTALNAARVSVNLS